MPFPLVELFHSLPNREESFGTIIDTFRLRYEDDYSQGGQCHGIYAQADPTPVFNDFLDRAEAVYMMPEWWDSVRRDGCVRFALQDDVYNIWATVGKKDIQGQYNDKMMPM